MSIALVSLVPLLYLVARALGGGEQALAALWRTRTLVLVQNTLVLAAAVTVSAALLSLPLAWLTARTDLPGRRLWSVIAALPIAVPSYVGAFTAVAAFGPRGALQRLLEPILGIERLPEIYGFTGAWLVLTLYTYPYLYLSLRGVIGSLDPALEEAARSLGHGPWRTFFRVTLPQLRPAMASGALLTALYVLSDFGAVSLLNYDAFTRAIYNQYRLAFDRSGAAGLALVLATLTVLIVATERAWQGPQRYHRSSAGAQRPLRVIRLGRWKAAGIAYCGGLGLLTLGTPLAVTGYWLVQAIQSGNRLALTWQAAWHSAFVSLLAALVTVVVAFPVALLLVRYTGLASRLVEFPLWISYALPGIVTALALVSFGARYLVPLYQTLAMLLLAYVIRFLPEAVGSLRASLLQVSPHLEEAARGLGSSPPRAWLRVTAPLLSPGIASGGALVFLTTVKELPVTLLLSPIGYGTLATEVWNATRELFWSHAALPALLLFLVAALPMAILTWRQQPLEHPSASTSSDRRAPARTGVTTW
jgi:iron(III) transport system permease protein